MGALGKAAIYFIRFLRVVLGLGLVAVFIWALGDQKYTDESYGKALGVLEEAAAKGIPTVPADRVDSYFDENRDNPEKFPHDQQLALHTSHLTLGSHSISHPRGGFTTAGASIVDAQSFSENISGTMDVTKIEGDRFWASFEMSAVLSPGLGAEPDPAQAVNVTGSISNASNLCPSDSGT